MKTIKIFDTTLRDGEQSPGCSMNKQEKLEVARQLEILGVDVIEAGFAISSSGDFESIQSIAKAVKNSTVCSLCRAKKSDIEAAAQSVEKAKKPRIHTFIATSPIHMEHKLKMSPEQVIEQAVEAVRFAKTFVDDVEFSAEDAGRSDWDFLVKICTEAIKAGATVLNIPDTVGYQNPGEYSRLIEHLCLNVPHIDQVDVSVHCHNDLGLATANSLAAIQKGATQVECTINGIGERAGNTALEEVVMALAVRKDVYNATTNINTKEITKTSRLVSSITGSRVQPNKAIVGANAFAHEAGIHQDGILKKRQTYEIMDAEMVGLKKNALVLGKHSGRHAFQKKLAELGFDMQNEELEKAFIRFKSLADKKKEIAEEDLLTLISDEIYHAPEIFTLKYVQIVAGNTTRPTATVRLKKEEEVIEGAEMGAGPVDAIYKTIDYLVGEPIDLVEFNIHSVTSGTDALGKVTVRIRDKNRVFIGRSSSLDVLVASAKAYLEAINKMLFFRQHGQIKPTI